MPEFKSSIGGRQFQGKQLREFDVPDINEEQFNVEAAINSGQLKKLNAAEIAEFQQRLNSSNIEEENNYKPVPSSRQQVQERPKTFYKEDLQETEHAYQTRRKGIERLSQGAKKRIEMLIGITRTVREVEINGHKFTLQTLLSKEMREAISLASEFDGNVQSPFEIRMQFLARSVSEIDGIAIEQFLGSNEIEDKLSFVNELDDVFLNRLYSEYLILKEEATQKYAISTKSEAEEVSDDLKK